jgi:hypothetical protein
MAGVGGPYGNQHAKKAAIVAAELRKYAVQEDFASLRKAVQKCWELAANGSLEHFAFIRDSLDGKPKQQVEVSGEDGGAISFLVKDDTERLAKLHAIMQLAEEKAKANKLKSSNGEVLEAILVETPRQALTFDNDASDLV